MEYYDSGSRGLQNPSGWQYDPHEAVNDKKEKTEQRQGDECQAVNVMPKQEGSAEYSDARSGRKKRTKDHRREGFKMKAV